MRGGERKPGIQAEVEPSTHTMFEIRAKVTSATCGSVAQVAPHRRAAVAALAEPRCRKVVVVVSR